MHRSALLASLTWLAIAAAPAAAARHDDHRATSRFLAAATTYLQVASAGEPQAEAALDTVIAHVNATCPKTLASDPATTIAQQQVELAFALAAGIEVGLSALQAVALPTTAFIHRLARLRWNDPALNHAAATVVRSREVALALQPPDLCAEVAAAAANGFAAVPPKTAAFIASAKVPLAGAPSIGNLLTLMKPYLTPVEKTRATRLRRLDARLHRLRLLATAAASPRIQAALLGR